MVLSPCAARVFIARMKLGKALQAKGGGGNLGKLARIFVDQGWRGFFVDKSDPRPPMFFSTRYRAQMAVGAMG